MTFSVNNYPVDDPRLAQAKLWEEAFVQELQAFQQRMAGTFQVAFMAEVGTSGSWLCGGHCSGPREVPGYPSWAIQVMNATEICDGCSWTFVGVPSRPPSPETLVWSPGWYVCSQRSLEDEINRTTLKDLPIFAISYLVIFVYITLALGSYSRCDRVLVRVGAQVPRPQYVF